MEYTFKNSFSERSATVKLDEYTISYQSDGKDLIIPYVNILSVRLKKQGSKYVTIIKSTDQPELHVSNQYILSNKQSEDISRQYITFVRVLHFHLREKSKACYVCGKELRNILFSACASVIIAFGLSFIVDSLQVNPFNIIATALVFSFLSIFLIVSINWGHFPNPYQPENIPLQFLPAA